MPEPITLVIEHGIGGGEIACVYRDRLPARFRRKDRQMTLRSTAARW